MKTLIVVDMQNDFVTGSLGTKEAQKIITNVRQKISEYDRRGDEIIFTRDTHYYNYFNTREGKMLPVLHCVCESDGWRIVDGLETSDCTYINKENFGWHNWGDRSFKEIEIIGVCTDICVISNAIILRAQFPEVNIVVDANCCAGTTPELHEAALRVMRSCQIDIIGLKQ